MKHFDHADAAYQTLLETLRTDPVEKPNRSSLDSHTRIGWGCRISLQSGFPLLTLKDMSGPVWESLVAEVLWYLSGEHHIRNLQKHTSIWDEWADQDGRLPFAYGRFWRRYPVPELKDTLPGEAWVMDDPDTMKAFVREETRTECVPGDQSRKVLVFDQIAYILDCLRHQPFTRRMVLNAWHPANGIQAHPPACHVMAVFNVTPGDEDGPQRLHCHLQMRSSDVGLGLPFNWAQYALLTHMLAQQVDGLEPGTLVYSGTDVHLYVQTGDDREAADYDQRAYADTILERPPRSDKPRLHLQARDSMDDYRLSDVSLEDYNPHPHIQLPCVP